VSFSYPENELDFLAWKMANLCDIEFETKVEKIDVDTKTLVLSGGREFEYDALISTLPLNKLLKITGLSDEEEPYTSVLVMNMGVELAENKISKHGFHWLYVPDSLSGFHRIGYYSNLDPIFLPESLRNPEKYGSLYKEFAFRGGDKPSGEDLKAIIKKTEDELKEYGFIRKVLVADPTWIEVAYTWKKPGNRWVENSLSKLVLVFNTLALGPLAQSLYPHVRKILRNDLNRGIKYIKKFSVIVTALTLPTSIFLLIFAPILVKVFFRRSVFSIN